MTRETEPAPDPMAQGRRLRAFLQHSFDVIALFGPDATVEYVSPAVERVLGYTPKEFGDREPSPA